MAAIARAMSTPVGGAGMERGYPSAGLRALGREGRHRVVLRLDRRLASMDVLGPWSGAAAFSRSADKSVASVARLLAGVSLAAYRSRATSTNTMGVDFQQPMTKASLNGFVGLREPLSTVSGWAVGLGASRTTPSFVRYFEGNGHRISATTSRPTASWQDSLLEGSVRKRPATPSRSSCRSEVLKKLISTRVLCPDSTGSRVRTQSKSVPVRAIV